MQGIATQEISSRKGLLLPSLLILPVTLAAFYFLPQLLGKTAGYMAGFVLYWLYCLLHGQYLKVGSMASLYKWPTLKGIDLWLVLLCFVPALGAFSAAFLLAYPYLNLELYLVLAAAALVNGTVEEYYWRGAFVSRYKQQLKYAFLIPALLFGLWHISVYAAYGISYQGGFLPLVGGAFFMGLLWGYTAYRQQRILVPTLAHILTNFFAFSNLLVDNWLK